MVRERGVLCCVVLAYDVGFWFCLVVGSHERGFSLGLRILEREVPFKNMCE